MAARELLRLLFVKANEEMGLRIRQACQAEPDLMPLLITLDARVTPVNVVRLNSAPEAEEVSIIGTHAQAIRVLCHSIAPSQFDLWLTCN